MISLLLALLVAIPSVEARDHYSYEEAERLKPLIEWRNYGTDAFNEAIEQNKPIYMLLTAPSWCHWCQVLESEEYLFNTEIYTYINENYIPIYVDADKRQDLTRQYLEGGWPSSTLMTPSRERIWGFSGVRPVPTFLENLIGAVGYVNQGAFTSVDVPQYKKTKARIPNASGLATFNRLYVDQGKRRFDPVYGGFGEGRKFPQPRMHMAFLDQYLKSNDKQWLQMVEKTLEGQYTKIEEIETNYNLYDPVFGGFHRYGTTRNYTPPHYEKMLYDNAKLLQLYARLNDATRSPLAKEVTDKTIEFFKNWFYDDQNGGFYGDSDAYTEHVYFGQVDRDPTELRVEKTKYTDWNADAIIAMFDVATIRRSKEIETMATKSLDLFIEEMIDENGPYHFLSPEGEKGVQGNIIDSGPLLVALMDGYNATNNERYKFEAVRLADYVLRNNYDWFGGGFFERNSRDTKLYNTAELRLFDKPNEQNGMLTWGMLNLFQETSDLRYFSAAMKTMGILSRSSPFMDDGYFIYLCAQKILDDDLIRVYEERSEEISLIDVAGQENFFVYTDPLPQAAQPNVFVPSTNSQLATRNSSSTFLFPLVLFAIAMLAGLLSFLSPCTLPILPAYVAAMLQTDRKKQLLMTTSFLAGLIVLFTLLGMSSSAIGVLLRGKLTMITELSGAIIIIAGIAMLSGKGFKGIGIQMDTPKTALSAFFFGGTLGLAWTPCVGPILLAILALAAQLQSSVQGGLLLMSYGIGLGIPLVALSGVLQTLPKNGKVWKVLKGKEVTIGTWKIHSTTLVSGVIFIVLGYLIFSGGLYQINRIVGTSEFQQVIYDIEDRLMNILNK